VRAKKLNFQVGGRSRRHHIMIVLWWSYYDVSSATDSWIEGRELSRERNT